MTFTIEQYQPFGYRLTEDPAGTETRLSADAILRAAAIDTRDGVTVVATYLTGRRIRAHYRPDGTVSAIH